MIFARGPPQRRDRSTDLAGERSVGNPSNPKTEGITVNTLIREDPAAERFEAFSVRGGHAGPTLDLSARVTSPADLVRTEWGRCR